jgi:choline-phosphate cytidylyltransferase
MEEKPLRIYADGVFDLFHFGHARLFEQIKQKYPKCFLMVGVCRDEDVGYYKRTPILKFNERVESVRHCKWVDEVIEGPWIIDENFMKTHQIDFVAHDEEPYPCESITDVYAVVKESGKFIPTERTPCISTTTLIDRVKDYLFCT